MRALLISIFSVLIVFYSFNIKTNEEDFSPVLTTNYSQQIAPILYSNCTGCHHSGGVGPMSLMTYQEAFDNRFIIQGEVLNGQMPPWPPDTTYSRFRHERILSAQEINLIDDWVNSGANEGDPTLAPTPPNYNQNGPQLGTPDLSLSAPTYSSNAFSSDDYVCFTIPSQLLVDKKIKAVEVVPGNLEIVHHCLVYIDPTGSSSPGIQNDCMGPNNGVLVGEFAPGSLPISYPGDDNMAFGMEFPANSNVILAMHYPMGSLNMVDSTKVHFYFYPDQINSFREIQIEPSIIDFNFCIPANQTKAVAGSYQIPANSPAISMYGVFPHMHLLGKNISTYAVNNIGDTTNLINIPNWDFEWQGAYSFGEMKKLMPQTTVYANAFYDNTSANPHNPNTPPQTVCAGFNTTDEMFIIYYLYTEYMPGDEHLDLDSLMNNGMVSAPSNVNQPQNMARIFPNPTRDKFTISLNENCNAAKLEIYTVDGKLIHLKENIASSNSNFSHDFNINEMPNIKKGNIYLCRLHANKNVHYLKLIVQ
ncbi:MAG: T9SS type A sorting domain-containing protein [Flavobacteriales bacterium]|nr:T9SS type A sorting domain-containing protein [Flavobacteriales bacterium]